MFCFLILILILILILVLLGERRKPRSDLAALCLIFAFFASFYRWFCLGWWLGLPQNLVQTPLDFPWFLRFFLLWYCLILSVAKGENLVKTRLDFAYFCAYLLWYCLTWCVAKGENLAQAWLDFAWFLCFFAIEKLDIAMVDGRGEDKTSFGIGLVLLDFCYWDPWSCLGWRAWRGQNLVLNWLDFAWFLLFHCIGCLVIVSYCCVAYRFLIVVSCYRSLVLSYWLCFYGSPLLLYWLSCYGIVVPVRETRHRDTERIRSWPRQRES